MEYAEDVAIEVGDAVVLLGDFNELLKVGDKRGGAPRSHNQMQQFRDVLDHCGFVDLGFPGPTFNVER